MKNNWLKLYLFFFIIISIYGFFRESSLPFLGGLMATTLLLLANLWNHYALSRVKIKKQLSKERVGIGEQVYFQLEFVNRKILPLFWVNITFEVTPGLQFARQEFLQQVRGQRGVFQDLFSLKWYERVKRSYLLIPEKRGVYSFSNGKVNASGIFGIFKQTKEIEGKEELVVFPKIVPLATLGIKLNHPFGPRPEEGWLFPDPLNRVGVRPYQFTDSLKMINWKASARHLQLESDIKQPAFEPELHIFLSTRTSERAWEGYDRELVEEAITYAASFVDYGFKKGFRPGLYTAGMARPGGLYTAFRPGGSPAQRIKLLTLLARLNPYSFLDFKAILAREKRGIKPGSTVIVITPFLDNSLGEFLYKYQQKYRLLLITARENMVESQHIKNTYYLNREGEDNVLENSELVK